MVRISTPAPVDSGEEIATTSPLSSHGEYIPSSSPLPNPNMTPSNRSDTTTNSISPQAKTLFVKFCEEIYGRAGVCLVTNEAYRSMISHLVQRRSPEEMVSHARLLQGSLLSSQHSLRFMSTVWEWIIALFMSTVEGIFVIVR